MLRRLGLFLLILGVVVPLAAPFSGSAQDAKRVFYWVSHGAPTDPVWTYFLQGAEQWGKDTGNDVRTSFHSDEHQVLAHNGETD
jgi:simple sugar transport system substrate-binding protein